MILHTSKNALGSVPSSSSRNGTIAISPHVMRRLEDHLKLVGGKKKGFIDQVVIESLDSRTCKSLADQISRLRAELQLLKRKK